MTSFACDDSAGSLFVRYFFVLLTDGAGRANRQYSNSCVARSAAHAAVVGYGQKGKSSTYLQTLLVAKETHTRKAGRII